MNRIIKYVLEYGFGMSVSQLKDPISGQSICVKCKYCTCECPKDEVLYWCNLNAREIVVNPVSGNTLTVGRENCYLKNTDGLCGDYIGLRGEE